MQKYKTIHDLFSYIIYFFVLIVFNFPGFPATAQINLVNPSFEDDPSDATTPMGWFECTKHTTPDILPGFWGVYDEPSDGNTYVGLITRSNSTHEAIGQRLATSVNKDVCYQFKIDLAHSETYAGYRSPLKLRIWISSQKCGRDQLVYESDWIEHKEWKTYVVRFRPKENYTYIFFEAFYSERSFSYRGNILMDNISSIVICSKA